MNFRQRIQNTIYNNFMATIPVYNPLSPFLGLIPGGFRVGQMIRIKGVINYYGHRFQINIQAGPALRPRDDVGLHLSVRPQEHAIVRNTLTNQIWGTEERHGGCPLNPGQHFDILLLAEHSCYKIAINGVHFCAFNHRMSLSRMQFISIEGDVTIHSIIQEGDTSGGAHAHPMPVPAGVPAGGVPVYPPTPYGAGGAPPYGSIHSAPYASAPPAPPPPPYSPYPHGGYGQPGVAYQPKKKSNKALKYAAGAAGVGAGIGLTALAISSLAGGGGGDDCCDDAGDVDVDF
ncbi:galectin-4-like isoform X2 [Lutzomyia longipalpis]|uniref:galectin-4-like isoform X2 n=1 Tax=Lutzomyia longipalpis TaxID=7200 RepID=UPI002483FD7F|nr:galectin-4-like isoform X2 [Lutzomyia longipalpis]